MPPRRSASSRNANGAANGNVKKEKEVPVVATIDDGDDETEEMAEIELSSDEEVSCLPARSLEAPPPGQR